MDRKSTRIEQRNFRRAYKKQDGILVQKIRPAPRVCVCNLESEIRSTEDQGDVWILRWMLREWVMMVGGL